MQNQFRKIAKISLILVYLVIIAGAVVRMTGSGMGCPDWPKCFGYYIPPTDASELEWKSNHLYNKGQVIIIDESLRVANDSFKTTSTYNKKNWKIYVKHDYAIFNVWHTWIEYINRLVTVILGIPILIMTFISFFLYKKNKILTIGSILTLFMIGVQAILGKIVVDTNLKAGMITIHMAIAFIIVAMLIFIIYKATEEKKEYKFDKITLNLLMISVGFTMLQVILGTQVREFVDYQIDAVGENAKQLWLLNPSIQFYIHRSFSILVVLLNLYIGYRIYKMDLGLFKINWVLFIILIEVITGMAMYYINFPFGTQPLHLVLASLLFGVQFYLVLEAIKVNNSLKTL